MTGRNSLHYCYDVSYQCWFASEEAKIYCNNFNSSNAVVCSHLILAYTVRLAIMNAVELERKGWFLFFYLYWGNVVLWLKRTSTKKLANRISYQIWYKGCLKGKFGRGVQICEGGPYPLADLDRGSKSAGGPNPLWHRISVCRKGWMDWYVCEIHSSDIFYDRRLSVRRSYPCCTLQYYGTCFKVFGADVLFLTCQTELFVRRLINLVAI